MGAMHLQLKDIAVLLPAGAVISGHVELQVHEE